MSEMRLLDLFCGIGGWSIGFYRRGFECTGVDIVDVGYPYNLILSDMRKYHPEYSPDVITASPPCTEFSTLTQLSFRKGQRGPPEPEKGMELVREALRVIDEAQPRYWLLENVYGSIEHISAVAGKPILLAKPWVLWGNVDLGVITRPVRKMAKTGPTLALYGNKGGNRIGLPEEFPFDPLRAWKRARIPVWLSMQIAEAVREELRQPVHPFR